jgi:uncharacterized protein with FMN-binding domain
MKANILKELIKSAVKDAIREEMKDILLEALRGGNKSVIQETRTIPQEQVISGLREKFIKAQASSGDIHSEMFTTTSQPFIPSSMNSAIEGALPPGEVDISQIVSLLK